MKNVTYLEPSISLLLDLPHMVKYIKQMSLMLAEQNKIYYFLKMPIFMNQGSCGEILSSRGLLLQIPIFLMLGIPFENTD